MSSKVNVDRTFSIVRGKCKTEASERERREESDCRKKDF
jgi:hypothetical protein